MSLLIGTALTASASQVLLNENFTAGTTTGWTNSGGTLTVTNDAGIGGNALTIVTTSNNRGATKLFSQPVTLGTGDFISVTMDYRLTFITNVNAGVQFRFTDSADSSYSALGINPGSTAASSSWFNRNGSTEGSKWANTFTNNLTAKTMTFTVTRTATNTLDYTVSWIGGSTFTKTGSVVTNSSDFTFDSLQIYFSGMKAPGFIIDDVSVTTSVSVESANLLDNGGFEGGDTGWSQDGQHTIVTNVKHSGSASLQYVATDTYAGLQSIPVVGGRQYLVSGWIKTDAGFTGTAGISLNFRDMNAVNLGNVLVENIRFPAGTDWSEVSQVVQVPTNAVLMKVMLVTGGTGLAWYDDLSAVKTNWPADPAMTAPANPPIAGTWTATFEDNFTGTELDGNKWKLGGLNGFAATDSERCAVSDGVLTITAAPVPTVFKGEAYEWSSASLSTYKKFRQLYGYFEARMRYETKVGMWPAFWTMPDRGLYGSTNENYKTYLKFDLTGISGPVTNAELTLRVLSTGANDKSLNIFPVGDSWAENTITWNNMPVENPLWLIHDFGFEPLPGDELVYDLTGYINQQLAGDKVASMVLCDTFYQATQINLGSRESAAATNRPQLVINGTAVAPSADAYVRSGSYAGSNYGTSTNLILKESWQRDNSSTFTNGMEIDVFEYLGIWPEYRLHSALHWDGYDAAHKSTNFPFYIIGETVAEYHTYGVYWEPGKIEFYFDGQSTGGVFSSNRVCSVPSYLIVCLQMGGWSGNENPANINTNEYPGKMEVDYIKAWSGTKQ